MTRAVASRSTELSSRNWVVTAGKTPRQLALGVASIEFLLSPILSTNCILDIDLEQGKRSRIDRNRQVEDAPLQSWKHEMGWKSLKAKPKKTTGAATGNAPYQR